jgi:hypothetical protein
MPLTSQSLASKVAPKLQDVLEAHKEQIVADAGGMVQRQLLRMAWPTIIGEVPALADVSVQLIVKEFGKLNINDLIKFLEDHAV